MIAVTLYMREDCHLCEQALEDLRALQTANPHQLTLVDVDGNRDLLLAYGLELPVVEVGPYKLKAPFDRKELGMTLAAASDREKALERLDGQDLAKGLGEKLSGADRFSYWLTRHYMLFFNLLVVIYLGLPFLAPVLMVAGITGPARVIYRAYSLVCHQLAYRSWFLFGEQAAYPHSAAGIPGLLTYSQATGQNETDLIEARQFFGDPQIGYKIALCERDVAIYGGILLFGLVFSLSGKRFKPLPWFIWVALGIIPIAADGLSQLLSQPPLNLIPPFNLLRYRESTPLLRTLTGALFGITTAWFGYPLVEESMGDSRRYLAAKFAAANPARKKPAGAKTTTSKSDGEKG
ncbi:MAG TPA: DUF2085 domain-containing protein [Anaerolineales bacterium]|nr:DUF2085 domain-containing protein [Anaerolineales bacterium]